MYIAKLSASFIVKRMPGSGDIELDEGYRDGKLRTYYEGRLEKEVVY